MALSPFRKKPEPIAPPRRSLTAAAAVLSDPRMGRAAWQARRGEDTWQKVAWDYYDSIGELNAAVRWVGNAVSVADLFSAETDPETGVVTEATDNRIVQAVTNSILGGPVKRAQAQQTITLNWLIAGEVFIVVRQGRNGDEWLVLSSTEIEERNGTFKYSDPITGQLIELGSRDIFIRVWSPHPRLQSHADSSVRSAIPILREVERTSMNIMARLDSRLVGAGILLTPEEMELPYGDEDAEGPQGFADLMRMAGEANLTNPGHASSQVPIIVPAPSEMIANGAFQHLSFSTELTQEVIDLREAAIRRLAMALDIPPEVMTGMGESSHWNAWQIEETTFKIHVAPLLDKIADALTGAYLQPVLKQMGVLNPERYVLQFNTTEIISRPNRFEELNTLFDKGLISEDFLRSELGIPDDAVPSVEEMQRMLLEKLLLQDTSLIAIPEAAELVGIEAGTVPADTNPSQRGIQSETATPAIERGQPEQGDTEDDNGLVAAAELMVWDALSRAGGRLLTREYRGQFGNIPKHELHTEIDGTHRADALLEGSFQFTAAVAPSFGIDPAVLETKLREYCRAKIEFQEPHNREELRRCLSR